MATKAAAQAVKEAVKPNFRVGGKQVFLPGHVVTLLPPKKIASPRFATFQVPLRFNKFDLRDYLYHVYGVQVRAVRSWLTARKPARRLDLHDEGLPLGAWYRPQPIKRMMVELVKPFAYPAAPQPLADERARLTSGGAGSSADGEEDDPRAAWDHALHQRMMKQQQFISGVRQRMAEQQEYPAHAELEHVPGFRVTLAQQARALLERQREAGAAATTTTASATAAPSNTPQQAWRSGATATAATVAGQKLDERWQYLEQVAGGTSGPTAKAPVSSKAVAAAKSK